MADGKWPMAGGNPARGVPGFCAFRLFAISYTLSALLVFSTRCRDGRGTSAEPGKRRWHHEARRPVRPWGGWGAGAVEPVGTVGRGAVRRDSGHGDRHGRLSRL